MTDRFADDKGRDSLAFSPLPPSRWHKLQEKHIAIATPYDAGIIALIKSLPGASWSIEAKAWCIPYRSAEALRKILPEVDRLATLAQARRDAEVKEPRPVTNRPEKPKPLARRLLRAEYLKATPDRPLSCITLEAIADNDARGLVALLTGTRQRQWVAQIYGSNGTGGWVRNYVRGSRDYSLANSKGSRGIMVSYLIEEGLIYQVSSPQSWKSVDRYFARAEMGQIIRMTEDDVIACLEKED